MFVWQPESEGALVCLKAVGRLTDADYRDMIPRLEAVIAAHGTLRLVADLTEFDGWEWQAAWDDLAFGIRHWNDVARIALLADRDWAELASRIAGALMRTEVRRFAPAERTAAIAWAKGEAS